MNHASKLSVLKAGVGLAVLLCLPSPGHAQVCLRSAASYTVLAGSAITNTGPTTITGDVGVSPGTAITGLPVSQPKDGTVHMGDAVAAQAQADLVTAYGFLAAMPCSVTMTGVDLGGKTLAPGVYCFATSAALTGILSLDANGDSSAVFVFQIGSTLTSAGGASVVLAHGAQSRHVWWQVGSSATLGIASAMQGNVLAHTSITLTTGASVAGKVLAAGGAVTMDSNSLAGAAGGVSPTIRSTWGGLKARYR